MGQTNPKKARPTGALAERRAQKREEADYRQKQAAARTPEEQLDILDVRGATATKERQRLLKMIQQSATSGNGKSGQRVDAPIKTRKKGGKVGA